MRVSTNLDKTIFLLVIIALIYFSFFRTIYNTQFDYFAFTTWGLANEIISRNKIVYEPYSDLIRNNLNLLHPNLYSKLFYPHIMLSIAHVVTDIPYSYFSFVVVLTFTLLFYLSTKLFIKDNLANNLVKLLTFIGPLLLLLLHQGYPSFILFYISFGIMIFWYLFYVILRSLIINTISKQDLIVIPAFIIVGNLSYYTSIFFVLLLSLLLLLSIISFEKFYLFRRLFHITVHPNVKFVLLIILISASIHLVIFNPVIEGFFYSLYKKDVLKDIYIILRDIITGAILTAPVIEISSYVDEVYRVLATLSRISIILLLLLFTFVYIMARKICSMPYVNTRSFIMGLLTVTSCIISQLFFMTVYRVADFPSIHQYPLNLSATLIVIVVGVSLLTVNCKKEVLRKTIILITFILLIFIISAPLYRSLTTSNIYDDVLLIKGLYNKANFIVNYAILKSEYSITFISDSRIAAYMYYMSTKYNKTLDIAYISFVSDPYDYNRNCRKELCFYIIAKMWEKLPIRGTAGPWSFLQPLGEQLYVILKENCVMYNDGAFFLLRVR